MEAWLLPELEPLLPSHSEGMAVDIGAHLGEWCNYLSERYTTVWAFEPQMLLAAQVFNMKAPNVQVMPLALADTSQVRTFTQYASDAHLSGVFWSSGINTGRRTGRMSLLCHPLDLFKLENVEFIKVDVEGMEVDVLLGAQETITLERPLLVVEVHMATNGIKIQEWLGELQYTIRKIAHPYYQEGTEYAERHYWLIGVP